MNVDLATLRAFSAALRALTDAAATAPPQRLIDEALGALQPLVPFRSAWWGECSEAGADLPRRNWIHGRFNLPAAFAREWNHLAEHDDFASRSMQQLGQVVRSTGLGDPVPAIEAFARRHDLFHCMAITVELAGSGLMFFVSLYRGSGAPDFDDTEAALFAEYSAHLVQQWRARVHHLLLDGAAIGSDAFALADAQGHLFYLGGRLGRLLHRRHAGWSGQTLPQELSALLGKAPCSLPVDGERLTLQPCGELVALALERPGRGALLPPREHGVAMLYARGHSYKEIARLLALSPATVRTYLRSAYLQLGVRNKVELGSALGRTPRAP